MRELGGDRILSGAQRGRTVLGALIASAAPADEPTPAFLDFSGIEVATTSFLRESVVAFRDYALESLPGIYPVVANALPGVIEELKWFVEKTGDALWCCDISDYVVCNAYVLGRLDPAEKQAFELVLSLERASAADLAGKVRGPKASTAWNNRLATLAAKGLLVEVREGKVKFFSPVLRAS
jgi:hypothetical protein